MDRLIQNRVNAPEQIIPDVTRYLVKAGGKRLRPLITLACANLCGYKGENHIALAAAIEFMHTATLLHDDVVDMSEQRRKQKTARLVWGNKATILVGDFLLGQAFKIMVETGSLSALNCLANAAATIARGEVMQLLAAHEVAYSEEEYRQVIGAKTATLFAAAAQVGPLIAGQSDEVARLLARYGHHLGCAFQISDDVLDYSPSQTLGKRCGDDFREGKVTLPVIKAMESATASDRAFWTRAFSAHASQDAREAALAEAICKLQSSQSLEHCIQAAQGESEQAIVALDQAADQIKNGDGLWLEPLRDVARFSVRADQVGPEASLSSERETQSRSPIS